jgi:hypothetical protein
MKGDTLQHFRGSQGNSTDVPMPLLDITRSIILSIFFFETRVCCVAQADF